MGAVLGIQRIGQHENLQHGHPLQSAAVGQSAGRRGSAVRGKNGPAILLDSLDDRMSSGQHATSVVAGTCNEEIDIKILTIVFALDAAIPAIDQ